MALNEKDLFGNLPASTLRGHKPLRFEGGLPPSPSSSMDIEFMRERLAKMQAQINQGPRPLNGLFPSLALVDEINED